MVRHRWLVVRWALALAALGATLVALPKAPWSTLYSGEREAMAGSGAALGQAVGQRDPLLWRAEQCFYQAQFQRNLAAADALPPVFDHHAVWTRINAESDARKAAERLTFVGVTAEGYWLLRVPGLELLYDPRAGDYLTEGYTGCGRSK